MRLVLIGGLFAIICATLSGESNQKPDATLVFSGDIRGYLSPCGCSKPQVGGIKRMSAVAKQLLKEPNSFFVDAGNWTPASGRQDELKAEAVMDLFRGLNAAYVNIGTVDVAMSAMLESLNELSGNALGSGTFGSGLLAAKTLSGGVCVQGANASSTSLDWPSEAKNRVALFSGDLESAKLFAANNPSVGLVIYSSQGDPLRTPIRVGQATLVTVGDKCRYVGTIQLVGGEWTGFRAIKLDASVAEDAAAKQIYNMYLTRVTDEKLIDQLPRISGGAKYVGSKACKSCHLKSYQTWEKSAHSHALKTLEKTRNDRDPECVGCHVVGLNHQTGFRARNLTANLADVGCESCHGAGGTHIKNPRAKYGFAGEKSCAKCHVPDHSPEFSFRAYWARIKH